ncbi:hypothetical protein IBX73_02715 [candidate division WOR-3 bacterium]|nr:hypothetical protein [candidate division WOR-3 bacterium]
MDTFVLVTGITGVLLFVIALAILINSVISVIRGTKKIGNFLAGLLLVLLAGAFASSLIYLSLFLQTFDRFTHEEKIGWVYAENDNGSIRATFYHAGANRMHFFYIAGNQWMIEGYFLRWGTVMRWLGADAYYRITRFTGRREQGGEQVITAYEIHPEEYLWKFLLRNAEKIPGVDAAYGIAAFQYCRPDTFYVYINNTGFILRTR